MMATDPRPWRLLDGSAARELESRLDAVVAGLAEGATSAVPAFAGLDDPRFRRDAYEASRVALERFVELVGTDEPALTPRVREVYVSLGAAEARENRGPEVVIAALRASSRLLLHEVVDALSQAGDLSAESVVGLADAVSAFVDELVTACTDGFANQVQALAGERDGRRARLLELLGSGEAPASALDQAALAVGWETAGLFAPVLLPLQESREARFWFGADGLVAERADHVLAVVRVGPRFAGNLLGPRLRLRGCVIGPTGPWSELAEAVRLSELAGRLVWDAQRVVRVEDHLITLALRGEPVALAALVRRRLSPFDVLPPAQRESLLVTVRSWLRHWGARGPVAAELYVHPQTVSYRIRQARQLLGDAMDDPRGRFELQLALTEALGGDA